MKYPIVGSIIIIILLSFTVCGLSLCIFSKGPTVLTVDTIAQDPLKYINQTITVKGMLSSVPQPRPTQYELSSENQTAYLYIDWNSSNFLISQINDTSAIVHGIVREENWTSPNAMPTNTLTVHIYYVEASSVELFNSRR